MRPFVPDPIPVFHTGSRWVAPGKPDIIVIFGNDLYDDEMENPVPFVRWRLQDETTEHVENDAVFFGRVAGRTEIRIK